MESKGRKRVHHEDLTKALRGVTPPGRISPLPKTRRIRSIVGSISKEEHALSPWIEGQSSIGKVELLPREKARSQE